MKKYIISLFIILYSLFSPRIIFADYVLPYPSVMPGNKMYKITRIIDELKRFWYFGKIAQEKYHLALADKYLVEAKTLFEYKQYLLGVDALRRSDAQFRALPKDSLTHEAAQKHTEVLSQLLLVVPDMFQWSPEKSASITLQLKDLITASIGIRRLW